MHETGQKGANHENIQEMNRSLIIRLLLENNINTRIELANLSGLNQATITNIIKDFIDWGLVRETGLLHGTKGRRSIAIEIVKERYKVICARLTRKYFSVAVFDLAKKCYEIEKCEIESFTRPETILSDLAKKILVCKDRYAQDVLLGVGLALPGPFMKERGEIVLMTESDGWKNINVTRQLQDMVGLLVLSEHDANAAALAEWKLLDEKGTHDSILCVMPGQGIGAGMIEGGALIRGRLGTAGEIGHMSIRFDGLKCECGNRGCLETYVSTYAINRAVQNELDMFPHSALTPASKTDDIIEAYAANDELACRVVNRAAHYLGFGIVNLINVLNPGIIIIGDELSKAGQPFLDMVVNEVRARVLPSLFENTQIRLSTYPGDTALLGTSILLIEDTIKHPNRFCSQAATDVTSPM